MFILSIQLLHGIKLCFYFNQYIKLVSIFYYTFRINWNFENALNQELQNNYFI